MISDKTRLQQPTSSGLSRIEILRQRHIIRKAVRAYLDWEGYTEIDAPLIVSGTTPDPAVESFALEDGRYLASSTEYQMKRLAMSGIDRLYSLTQNFRAGDAVGAFRNPEFTMVEFGRVGIGMGPIEMDVEGFVTAAMRALGLETMLTYQGRQIDMRTPWERLSVKDAIARATGVAFEAFDLENCRRAVTALGLDLRADWVDDLTFLFSLIMDTIQPRLGELRPVFVREWPLYETTSAKSEDGIHADRSELFIAGIELADGFAALADADIQTYLFAEALARRAANGQQPVELDQKYLTAMRDDPPFGAGMALGFDRLVMLLTDQPHIRNVLAFHWDEL
jgi:elongation factor P--beta-lysine ligase